MERLFNQVKIYIFSIHISLHTSEVHNIIMNRKIANKRLTLEPNTVQHIINNKLYYITEYLNHSFRTVISNK